MNEQEAANNIADRGVLSGVDDTSVRISQRRETEKVGILREDDSLLR